MYGTDPDLEDESASSETYNLGSVLEGLRDGENDDEHDELDITGPEDDELEAQNSEPAFVAVGEPTVLIAGFREHEVGMVSMLSPPLHILYARCVPRRHKCIPQAEP